MAEFGEIYETEHMPKGEGGFMSVPAGWYTVAIVGGDVFKKKDSNNESIMVQFKITAPDHVGRQISKFFNVRHSNPETEKIGNEQFGDLLRAIGVVRAARTEDLIGYTLEVKVAVKRHWKNKDGDISNGDINGNENSIVAYRAMQNRISPAPAPAPRPAASAPAPASTVAPASNAAPAPREGIPAWAQKK